jgi:hypothetical protein
VRKKLGAWERKSEKSKAHFSGLKISAKEQAREGVRPGARKRKREALLTDDIW